MRINKKTHNPLLKRIPKELIGDWRKYLVVSLFLILVIGFVSGMYVANESMLTAANAGMTQYKLEDGHFELTEQADEKLLTAIASGEKADVKAYYIAEAKEEFDDTFEDEFKKEFKKEFTSQFTNQFDSAFRKQVKSSLVAQGLDEAMVEAMLPEAIKQAKASGEYRKAYNSAYNQAYRKAYQKAYKTAYDEAWQEVLKEIDEEYAEAEETYQLNDPNFKPVPVTVYENFYRHVEEDNNNDGIADGTVRVYAKTDLVNLACLMEGRLPETDEEIAIDRMHADNVGIKVGDQMTVGGKTFRVVGLIAYVNYSTLHEKNTDLIFDALKFNVAMVNEGGFDSLEGTIHYAYAWHYVNKPIDSYAEKELADDVLPALLTQTIVSENELVDYLPAYANVAIHFASDDMGSDLSIGGVLLDILIIIIAYIFAITISNTMTRESKTIGTLRASGYTKGELIRHYLAMPLIVTMVAAAIGNVLGYTIFKDVVVSMYYNSYSLPTYETIWNPDAFVHTTLIPVALMFVVNLTIIAHNMRHTPLQFLRSDLKKVGRKKSVRLPNWKFFSRFRLRIILQNIPNYVVLFFGIFFVSVMLAMAVGMPNTLDYYKKNVNDMMFSKYQYVLKSYEDEDGKVITTANHDAEPFGMTSLQKKSPSFSEEIAVYGIVPDSKYVTVKGLAALQENEVYLSLSYGEKYGISIGDTITLDEKYENKQYTFKVAGFYEPSMSIAVFMPMEQFRTVFDLEAEAFSGYLCNTEITDLDEDMIATVITERDITKMCDQLDHSIGSYMEYFQVLCILLAAVMIYLLSKIIIEKNENAIAMTKILGYENREIARLYLLSTTIVLVITDAISTILGALIMRKAWDAIMSTYSGWFTFRIGTTGYAKMFLFVLIGYMIVMVFDFRRIQKIPMDQALKNVE